MDMAVITDDTILSDVNEQKTLMRKEQVSPLQEIQNKMGQDLGNEEESSNDEDPSFNPNDGEVESSSSDGRDNKNTKKKTRKHLRKENLWARNVKKQKINSGQEYTSRLGKVHRPKRIKPPCNENCLYKCATHVSKENKISIFQQFYKLSDKTRQREYLLKCMTTSTPKKVAQNPDNRKHRKINHAYYFEVNCKNVRVCKCFFMAILDIFYNNTISTAIKKAPNGFLENDMRGTRESGNKTPINLINDVEDHINSFPKVESHYCRARTEKEYIDGSLSISSMYKFYKERCEQDQKPYVQEPVYGKVFNIKFNISFFQQKKDQCSFCVIFEKYSSETERALKQNEYDLHKENVRNSRLEKKKIKTYLSLKMI
ncbi:uncharacterized protein LOC126737353 [Anthonomus grandis grandis]|uniref:uncharacterized protein LOC126737353 n=1 Tax=Anthonomus grandis grandis TaxID=2921223 RepID=UPI002165EA5A|nr:uncharacterized protein LOC126737353 [Anthonomus grandis grandis]XP_050298181.1 uncharacterized protein LOC126737353 [Anthonomus grandis grandis]